LFSCKDTTRLLSEAMERTLPARQRLTARIHLLLCTPCSRIRKHLLFLRDAARQFDQAAPPDGVRLSVQARARILQALKQQGHSE
jgi:hypothetical protein